MIPQTKTVQKTLRCGIMLQVWSSHVTGPREDVREGVRE